MDTNRLLGPGDEYEGQEQEEHAKGKNPLLTIHLLLQGRYWLAILLAIVGIAIGAVLGYKLPKPVYTCTGTIDVRPVVGTIMPAFDQTGSVPMFDSFISLQMQMIISERCLDNATLSPLWLDGRSDGVRRSNSPDAQVEFRKNLSVAREGELIRVTYSDPDAKTSQDAVAALIRAYDLLKDDIDPDSPRMKEILLQKTRQEYMDKVTNLRSQMREIAAKEGMILPEEVRATFKNVIMDRYEAEKDQAYSKSLLDQWDILHKSATTQAAKGAYTPMQILQLGDPGMRSMYEERRKLLTQKQDLEFSSNVGVNSAQMKFLNKKIEAADKEMEEYAKQWEPLPSDLVNSKDSVHPALTQEQLKDELKLKQEQEKALSQREDGLAQAIANLDELDRQIGVWDGLRMQTERQLEALRLSQESAGRIVVLNTGERPVLKDRRIPIAAAASFGGAILGFGLVVLFGLMDRRLRTIDQARMSLKQGMRVLGMLPSLPKNLEDPSAASFAALCVHHIRMLLQVMPRLDGHPTIAITSPSPGDGKTSLTLALALSYAAAGKSTLLIDSDIVGAGMTRRVNAIIRRRIGQILIRENLITPAELREALSTAQRSGRKLGEVLVDEGFVDADQLTKALVVQGETSVGLLDVMRGEMLEDCVADTGTPRLWILPVGSAMAEHGATISPEGFRMVLEQARKRFDVILIDTGPIPGSIESSVAASQADGVVLTVSRGEQGPMVKRASEHLQDIGGRVLGIVFNRASPEDFNSSYGAMSSPSIPERVRDTRGTDVAQFGPVAAAVAGKPANPEKS